jgi:uncharacterized protein YqeY
MRARIEAALKEAMKARDATRTSTLRLVIAALKDRDIAARNEEGSNEASEADILAILGRMVRQREESAHAYEEGGRLELAERERAEIGVIREFMPRPMDQAEVDVAVADAIADTEAQSIKDMGRVIGALKERYPGRMDFARVGAQVRQALCH